MPHQEQESSADNAFEEEHELTNSAPRSSAELPQPTASYHEQRDDSKQFPAFDPKFVPDEEDWPLPAPQPQFTTSYGLQHSASTPFLQHQFAGPSTDIPRRALPLDAQRPFTAHPSYHGASTPNLWVQESSTAPKKATLLPSPSGPYLNSRAIKRPEIISKIIDYPFLSKLKNGVKNLLRGKESEKSDQKKTTTSNISFPFTFAHIDSLLGTVPAAMTSPRRLASLDEMQKQAAIDTQAGPSEPSPPRENTITETMYRYAADKDEAESSSSSSIYHDATVAEPTGLEHEFDNLNLYSDPRDEEPVTVGNAQAGPSSPHLEQSAGTVDEEEEEDLLPAEREARNRGLTNIDFEPVRAMNAESDETDLTVRVYSDVPSEVVASRAVKPIYDGKSVANKGAEPIGQWRCCVCKEVQDLFKIEHGDHLVTKLECSCFHNSCDGCILTGNIKIYKPVQEPIPVQLSDDEQKQILFGIFCSNCGESWRAQEVKGSANKISTVPKDLAKLGAASLDKLRSSRSTNNLREGESSTTKSTLNLRQLSNEMEKEHGQQAGHALVKFSGIKCTCGSTSDSSSLGCQIVVAKEEKEEVGGSKKPATFTATPYDRARGIQGAFLTFEKNGQRVRHPNPLRSAPSDAV